MTRQRSIPACAGKPRPGEERPAGGQVDPRVCGETSSANSRSRLRRGRSPRVRGNRRSPITHLLAQGSIPACAGKPLPPVAAGSCAQVDPRVCGETAPTSGGGVLCAGRSPRVRGNLPLRSDEVEGRGSIPACAGKPETHAAARGRTAVDPRVCGETLGTPSARTLTRGRSPRVRGNHAAGHRGGESPRSIPACAGKPGIRRRFRTRVRVDPRVCGETPTTAEIVDLLEGRSPRVRGNP